MMITVIFIFILIIFLWTALVEMGTLDKLRVKTTSFIYKAKH